MALWKRGKFLAPALYMPRFTNTSLEITHLQTTLLLASNDLFPVRTFTFEHFTSFARHFLWCHLDLDSSSVPLDHVSRWSSVSSRPAIKLIRVQSILSHCGFFSFELIYKTAEDDTTDASRRRSRAPLCFLWKLLHYFVCYPLLYCRTVGTENHAGKFEFDMEASHRVMIEPLLPDEKNCTDSDYQSMIDGVDLHRSLAESSLQTANLRACALAAFCEYGKIEFSSKLVENHMREDAHSFVKWENSLQRGIISNKRRIFIPTRGKWNNSQKSNSTE